MLAEDISRVDGSREVMKGHHTRCNCLTDTVKGQNSVPFVEPGMWDGGTIYHSLVVTKHVAFVANGDSKVTKGAMKVNNLLNAGPGSHKLRTICGSFNCCLLLGIPINWCLV